MTKEQLPEGGYFVMPRQLGLQVVISGVLALAGAIYWVQSELSDHRLRINIMESANISAQAIRKADHDSLIEVTIMSRDMLTRLHRIEGALMTRDLKRPGP